MTKEKMRTCNCYILDIEWWAGCGGPPYVHEVFLTLPGISTGLLFVRQYGKLFDDRHLSHEVRQMIKKKFADDIIGYFPNVNVLEDITKKAVHMHHGAADMGVIRLETVEAPDSITDLVKDEVFVRILNELGKICIPSEPLKPPKYHINQFYDLAGGTMYSQIRLLCNFYDRLRRGDTNLILDLLK